MYVEYGIQFFYFPSFLWEEPSSKKHKNSRPIICFLNPMLAGSSISNLMQARPSKINHMLARTYIINPSQAGIPIITPLQAGPSTFNAPGYRIPMQCRLTPIINPMQAGPSGPQQQEKKTVPAIQFPPDAFHMVTQVSYFSKRGWDLAFVDEI